MTESAEQRFWDHFDNWENWRDGSPDTQVLGSMTVAEGARVELELLKRLSSGPANSWVPSALGHMKSQKAEAPLRTQLRSATGSYRVAVAEALWHISADEQAVRKLVGILKRKSLLSRLQLWWNNSKLDLPRIHAAVALGRVNHPESRSALEQATEDKDYYVSYNAKSALHRLKTGVYDPIAQMAEEGWEVTRDADGNTIVRRPENGASQK